MVKAATIHEVLVAGKVMLKTERDRREERMLTTKVSSTRSNNNRFER
jgi:hypothetical protein